MRRVTHARVLLAGEPVHAPMGAARGPVPLQLAADGDVYQVVAIDAGSGNGWVFSPAVIERAVPLFQRVNVYFGHAGDADRGPVGERKPAGLAGVFSGGRYDQNGAAIRGRLRLAGPAAAMARAVAEAYLGCYEAGEPAPDVGLSASLSLVADGRVVTEIVEVESLDVIGCRPARGGRFEAALAAMEDQDMAMRVQVALAQAPAAATDGVAGPEPGPIAATIVDPTALAGTVTDGPASTAPAGASTAGTVTAALPATAGVPAAPAPAVPQTDLATLQALIAQQGQQIAQLTTALAAQAAPAVVQGVTATDGGRRDGQVRVGQTPLEQLQTSVDALFGVRLPVGTSLARLRGIKELYLLVTGDDEMRGIFRAERAQFANATSTTLNDLVKNALNKYLQQYFMDAYLWWEEIATIVDFGTLQDPTWITMGGFGDLPTVAEAGTYTELSISDASETSAWVKKGGFIGITLEAIDKDDTGGIAAIPRGLAAAAYRTLSASVASIFTANAGVGPTLSDALALFHATHNNLAVTALSAASWEAAIQAMYKQTQLQSGRRLGAKPERLIVPIELEATARQIVGGDVMDANLQPNVRKGSARVVVCPEFADANDWAAVADPMKNPGIGIGFRFGRVPEVFSDPGGQRMFTNDQLDLKVRYFFTIGVIDYRAVLKRNVP